MEKILHLDQQLLIFLNNLGSETYDGFWLYITSLVSWIPFFLFIFYALYKKVGWKHLGLIVLILAFLILFTDQTATLFKNNMHRLRPCYEPDIKGFIRIVKTGGLYSFFSGHATNSMGGTLFFVLILRRYYKFSFLLFLFPLIFAYSRIYLGLHYPSDIIVGYLFGMVYGMLFYKVYLYFQRKYFPEN